MSSRMSDISNTNFHVEQNTDFHEQEFFCLGCFADMSCDPNLTPAIIDK